MLKKFFVVFFTILLSVIFFISKTNLNAEDNKEFASQGLIIKYNNGTEISSKKISVKFKDTISENLINQLNNPDLMFRPGVGGNIGAIESSKEFSVEELDQLVNQLNNNPLVDFAEPAYIMRNTAWNVTATTAKPSDFNETKHAFLNTIKLPELWKILNCDSGGNHCGGSQNVIIAILDTGLTTDTWTWSGGINDYGTEYQPPNELNTNNLHLNSLDDYGDMLGNGCPGVCGVDDDNDGKIDEDIAGRVSGDPGYDILTAVYDDDENGYPEDKYGIDYQQLFLCRQAAQLGSNQCYGTDQSKIGRGYDEDGHGTFIANLIAGKIDNPGDTNGDSVGIAYNTKILPIKISYFYDGESISDTFNMSNSLRYAVDRGADIITISFVTSADSSLLKNAIEYAESKGVLVVAAAGNTGGASTQAERAVKYPAAYPTVIAVGAATIDGTARASYSSYGSPTDPSAIVIDVLAPVGNGVYAESLSCYFSKNCPYSYSGAGNAYKTFSGNYSAGTSFAAPQVAAVAAYLKSKSPGISLNSLRRNLINPTNSALPTNQKGYGVANINNIFNLSKTDWVGNGMSEKNVSMVEFKGKIYQAVIGKWDKVVYTRNSIDGVNWSQWLGNGMTELNITMIADEDYIYQSVVGLWDDRVYFRRSTDGVNWTPWLANGMTKGEISLVKKDNVLYQSVRGKWDNAVYTRNSLDQGLSWTSWLANGMALSNINLTVMGNEILQSVVGFWDNVIYTRKTLDGVNWSEWIGNGMSEKDVSSIVFKGNIYQSVTGKYDNKVYTRRSVDGISWTNWEANTDNTFSTTQVSMGQKNSNLLYQGILQEGRIKIRFSFDGLLWSDWGTYGYSKTPVIFKNFDDKLFVAVTGLYDSVVYTSNL